MNCVEAMEEGKEMKSGMEVVQTLVTTFREQATAWLEGPAKPLIEALNDLQAAYPLVHSSLKVEVCIGDLNYDRGSHSLMEGLEWAYDGDESGPLYDSSYCGTLPSEKDSTLSQALAVIEWEQSVAKIKEYSTAIEVGRLARRLSPKDLAELKQALEQKYPQECQESFSVERLVRKISPAEIAELEQSLKQKYPQEYERSFPLPLFEIPHAYSAD